MASKFKQLSEELGIIAPAAEQTKFLTDEVNALLINQITNELKGHYAYTTMRAYFKGIGLDGFANYFKKQAEDEATHAEKVISFLIDSGSVFQLQNIPAPEESSFNAPSAAATVYLAFEKSITKNWLEIYQKAQDTKCWTIMNLAQWFLDEQVKEEDDAITFLQKVMKAGDNSGLLILDQEFAKRV